MSGPMASVAYNVGMATLQNGEMVGGLDRYASGEWRATPSAS